MTRRRRHNRAVDPKRARALVSYIEDLTAMAGDKATFVMEHTPQGDNESFSMEAMDQLDADIMLWIGSRIMRRWNTTNEPPSHLTVQVHVTVA